MSCTRRFVSLGALVSHLESDGVCASQTAGVASQWLNRMVSSGLAPVDQVLNDNIFVLDDDQRSRSSASSIHMDDDDDDDDAGDSDVADVKGPGDQVEVRAGCATELSWNGTHYECVLCHKTLLSLPALNAHLRASRLHRSKVYRCPRARGYDGCGKKVRSLRELVRHIEEVQCGTVRRFREELNGRRGGLGISGQIRRLRI